MAIEQEIEVGINKEAFEVNQYEMTLREALERGEITHREAAALVGKYSQTTIGLLIPDDSEKMSRTKNT